MINLVFSQAFSYFSTMTQIEKQAWELIVRMTPVQQYYFALKILQSVEPKNMEEASVEMLEEILDQKVQKEDKDVAQLVLSRKQQFDDESVKPISVARFAEEIKKRIEQHRS